MGVHPTWLQSIFSAVRYLASFMGGLLEVKRSMRDVQRTNRLDSAIFTIVYYNLESNRVNKQRISFFAT
jgi:hypothetical protein